MDFIIKKYEDKPGHLLIGATIEQIKSETRWDLNRALVDEEYRTECVCQFMKMVEAWSGFHYRDNMVHGFYDGYMWVHAEISNPIPEIKAFLGDIGETALILADAFQVKDGSVGKS